jgi:hypothetical protein
MQEKYFMTIETIIPLCRDLNSLRITRKQILESDRVILTYEHDFIIKDTTSFGANISYINSLLKDSNVTYLALKIDSFNLITLNNLHLLSTSMKNATITSLDMSLNQFTLMSTEQWQVLFNNLKNSSITELNLSFNNIFDMSATQWQMLFEILAESNITSLNLSCNNLYAMNTNTLQVFCAGLANSNITELNLSGNLFRRIDITNCRLFFSGLATSKVKSLNLSRNQLRDMELSILDEFLTGIVMSKVTSLDLSDNELLHMNKEQLQILFTKLLSSEVKTLNLSYNFLGNDVSIPLWEDLFIGLKTISNINSCNFSGNFLLDIKDDKMWQSFCDIFYHNNISHFNLLDNYFERISDNQWNILINALKQSQIKQIDFGKNTIKKLSAARKKDLAELHLTQIPSDRYQNMTILQFAYMVYSLNCKITRSTNDPSNEIIKKTWLVAELISENILKKFLLDNLRHNILEDIPTSDGIFQTPIKSCKESYGLIRQIYNDNAQLRTICVAHSESFMSPIAEFIKAIDINHADIIKSYLHDLSKIDRNNFLTIKNIITPEIIANILDNKDREALDIISKDQRNINILQLKSIKLIASQYDKQEIVSRIENIINLRESVATSILNLCISGKKELINESLIDICKSNNLEYQENDQLKLFIQNIIETYKTIKNEDKPKIVAEITQQILTNIEQSIVVSEEASAVNGAVASHVDRVVEQKAVENRQTEL